MPGGYSDWEVTAAKIMARRKILSALGVMRPEPQWDAAFRALIERAVERTYPDYFSLAEALKSALAPDAT